jgi:glycosyltransferase involved in cell wall biosynthesis
MRNPRKVRSPAKDAKSNMKISMLGALPPIKGVSSYTVNLLAELAKNCKFDFYGFKSIYPEFLYPGGTMTNAQQPRIQNVHIRNTLTWYNPFSWLATALAIKTGILHVQWWSWLLAPVYLTVLSIARLRHRKIIMTVHNIKPHEKSLLKSFLNQSVLHLAHEYIVHSESNRRLLIQTTGTGKKIHVIPIGTTQVGSCTLDNKTLRQKFNFRPEDKILLFFGNIRHYKGLDTLLQALAKIENPRTKLIIAGQPWTDFTNYHKIINQLNLKQRVKLFLEFVPDSTVAELFELSQLVVLPYKQLESASAVASVALAFAKPLLVTDVASLSELVNDKKTIAQPNNADDLKEKILYALENLDRLQQDTREKAQQFSWQKTAEKTLNVYKSCLEN